MKKFGNYLIAVSLIFSAAVFGASLLDQASSVKQAINFSIPAVDTMGNVSGN